MNLHHLRIFYTVAQRRSITAAAEDLLLSQPAVSLQLKALEKELGMPLFQRGGSKLALTQAGEVLYRSAVSILHAKEEVERSIGELRDGTKGRLILGAGTTGGMYVLPRIVQAYKGLWPETEIVFHIGNTDHILEKLLENVVDMGLVGGPIDDRRFVVEPVCPDELVLIAAPTHPIVSLGKVTLKDLAGLPFIVPEAGSRTRQLVERNFRDAGVPFKIAMQLSGTEGVKRGVEARLGVGMVSRYAVESECQHGVLQRVPIEGWGITRTMNLVYRNQKYFSPVGERFRDFAKSYGERHLGQPVASTPRGEVGGPRGPGGARRAGGRARGVRSDRE
ncbi:MAG: LysR family transcriptional regulator [Candidatus Rokubacteria bacterium]|nr:LysR family transcriptional regulator [Candidatus Rokubacteria bacterium]MBI2527417.1 LysR family transcriptional regulator [Candidatus Rokubacteria bacterium]